MGFEPTPHGLKGRRSRPTELRGRLELRPGGWLEWGYDPMQQVLRAADEGSGSRARALYTRRHMSTTQMIIVTVLSLAVVALLMARQRQIN